MRKNVLRQALQFATSKHRGQVYNGMDFIVHPIATVCILEAVMPQDTSLLAAGYLHDTIEDTPTTYKELKKTFNQDIADLVLEVTKVKPKDKSKSAYFPNLKTQRGIILKFADRLSNISNMKDWNDEKKQWYLNKSKFWSSNE